MAPAIEDTMFFPRLRRHAKWMFVFLALVFAVGFVGFGVGAGGTGIGDILRNGGRSDGLPSISDSRKKTEQNPKDAKAWRDLATALQTDGKTDEATTALNAYVALKPADPDALRELASLYLAQGGEKRRQAQLVQLQAAYAGASQTFPGALTVGGQTVLDDKIGKTVAAGSSEKTTELLTEAGTAYSRAVSTYQRIARLQPNDPNVQLELASTAQQTNDLTTAIASYERFLELAPDDPSAAIVKRQLKQLRNAQKQVSPSTSSSSG